MPKTKISALLEEAKKSLYKHLRAMNELQDMEADPENYKPLKGLLTITQADLMRKTVKDLAYIDQQSGGKEEEDAEPGQETVKGIAAELERLEKEKAGGPARKRNRKMQA